MNSKLSIKKTTEFYKKLEKWSRSFIALLLLLLVTLSMPVNSNAVDSRDNIVNNAPNVNKVELGQKQYQRAINDFKQIFSHSKSAADEEQQQKEQQNLSFLRTETMPAIGLNHYFPEGENQGYVVIKTSIKKEVLTILQVPHAFFDVHSLDIAQQMFDTKWVDVLMVNTQHRYETEHSDLSRLRYSLFTAVIEALQQLDRQVKVIQVHGFNETKRKTTSASNADFILSNGSVVPDIYLLQMQSCLRDNAQLLGRTYGRDVFELGATINPIGKLINSYNKASHRQNPSPVTEEHITTPKMQFLHIEIPRKIRNALIQSEGIITNTGSSIGGNDEVLKCLLNH